MEIFVHTADGSLKAIDSIAFGTRVRNIGRVGGKSGVFGTNPQGVKITEGIYRGEKCIHGFTLTEGNVCVEVELRASGMRCSHINKKQLKAIDG